jgi:hypothetical protein
LQFRAFIAIAMAVMVGGCASSPTTTCNPGEERAVQDTLYFGTAKPNGGVVANDEWTEFLEIVVTPRFPQGLTVVQASGQWRGADGSIVRESTRILQLVHPDDALSEKAAIEIAADYKSRFQQEAVLRVKTAACASF